MVALPDGRLVVAGFASREGSGNADFALARLTASGALDPSFGSGGRAVVDAFGLGGPTTQLATSLVALPDGRLVVAGYAGKVGSLDADFAVARLLGDPDVTPPRVVEAVAIATGRGKKRKVTGFRLVFSESLDVSTASSLENYALAALAKNKRGRKVALRSVAYDAATNRVTLTLKGKPTFDRQARLTVRSRLVDLAGNALDGDGNGTPGPGAVLTVATR